MEFVHNLLTLKFKDTDLLNAVKKLGEKHPAEDYWTALDALDLDKDNPFEVVRE